MQGSTPRWIVLSLALFALTSSARPVGAAFDATLIGALSAGPSADVYTYTYTLTVLADSTVAATEVRLSLPFPIDAHSITSSPDLFNLYGPGDPQIDFVYAGSGIGIGGLGVAESATFSFTSAGLPGQVGYSVGQANPTVGVLTGTAIGPVVPEPSSLILCGLGAIAAPFALRRRRLVA